MTLSQDFHLNLSLSDFKLPAPRDLSLPDQILQISNSISRICEGGLDVQSQPGQTTETGIGGPTDLWMLLIVRMITRVSLPPPELYDGGGDLVEGDMKGDEVLNPFYEKQDQLRQTLCDYVMSDFPSR